MKEVMLVCHPIVGHSSWWRLSCCALAGLADSQLVWSLRRRRCEQVREVVEYAAQRFITVVPEIELPGHCRAALACYTHLSCAPPQATAVRAVECFWGSCCCT